MKLNYLSRLAMAKARASRLRAISALASSNCCSGLRATHKPTGHTRGK